MSLDRPVRTAVVNDYPVVVAGVAAMLRSFADRIAVADAVLLGEPIRDGPIDVALYDTYGHPDPLHDNVSRLADLVGIGSVVVFSASLSADLVADATAAGAGGCISKRVTGPQLVDGLVRIASGEHDVLVDPSRLTEDAADIVADPVLDALDWPGKASGLSERESQVLALVAEGFTNAEIGGRLYLGAETVKTYLRHASHKLGFHNRVQAATYVARSDDFARDRPRDR